MRPPPDPCNRVIGCEKYGEQVAEQGSLLSPVLRIPTNEIMSACQGRQPLRQVTGHLRCRCG